MATENAYLAMGLAPDDAAVMALRRDLAFALYDSVKDMTQQRAAELLGVPQSTVSKLKNGRIGNLSVEYLARAMVRAGLPGWAEWRNADSARAGVGELTAALTSSATHIATFDDAATHLQGRVQFSFDARQTTIV